MAVYKVLIVEDEPSISDSLSDILECLSHQVVGVAPSAGEAMEILGNNDVDIALLDIQLKGEKDGIQLAEQIRSNHNIPYVFTTAFADPDTIKRAGEKGPYGYIVKPYGMKDIHAAVEIAMSNFKKTRQLQANEGSMMENNHLYVKVDSRLIRIEDDEIAFVEAKGDYAVFNTDKKGYIVHSTMKNIENKLDKNKFLKVHRSFIVNMSKIVDIEDYNLLIKDKVIPVSRANRESLMKRINLI